MNYEKIYLTAYKDAWKKLHLIHDNVRRSETLTNDDYYEDGFISGMEEVIKIMFNAHKKEIEKELDKLR